MPPLATSPVNPIGQQASSAIILPACVALLCTAVLITILGQYTDLDLLLADLYFDSQRQIFPWDTTWFAKDFMHGHVKNVLRGSGFMVLALTLVDFVRPLRSASPRFSARLRVLSLAFLIEPYLIRYLKQNSNMHCPWGIDRYGGNQPLLRLLDWVPEGWNAGHCFPAGHASAAIWLCALAVFWLPHSPRKASLAFVGGIGAGFFLGWVQQMRGQHFLTHTLWTAWLASALLLGLVAAFSGKLLTRPAASTTFGAAPLPKPQA